MIFTNVCGASVTIDKLVRKGLLGLKSAKSNSKEQKRFKEIYRTVYRHARKKGQAHKQALRYCWNVYAEQAPHREKVVVRNILRDLNMTSRDKIREMIMQEIRQVREGDVIQMSDFSPPVEDTAVEQGTPFEMFLSNIHAEMMDFMNENFETMSPEEGNFLDELLDSIEDVLGISEEAGIEALGDDEIVGDIEDED